MKKFEQTEREKLKQKFKKIEEVWLSYRTEIRGFKVK